MLKSFRTTLAGLFVGLIPISTAVLEALRNHQAVDFHSVLFGAGIIVLGILAKDASVTTAVPAPPVEKQ